MANSQVNRKKLTLISITYRGRLFTKMLDLPVQENGQVKISRSQLQALADECGVIPGTTFTWY
ncbi:MAG TPA: hypothetical protein V6C65_02330 [Allocoleopsis sp.]